MNIALVFSGQGAQYTGMGKSLYEGFEACKDVFVKAEGISGLPIRGICFNEGCKDILNDTKFCQPCILTHCAAVLAVFKPVLEHAGIKPICTAGLSLGEYTALMYSGAMKFEQALGVLCRRGRYMSDASALVDGVMSAVLGLDADNVMKACRDACLDGESVAVSNYNAPGQIVISGARAAVERAEILCREAGAKRCLRLPVSGPYHSVYMKPAAKKLEKLLNSTEFNEMTVPVISNVDGCVISGKENIVPTLVQQVTAAVKWEECVKEMSALGADTFIEIGPGRTLSSFIRKINPDARVYNIEDTDTFEKAVKELCQ